jgi:hypothetical protein
MTDDHHLEESVIEAVARADWNRRNPGCEWETDVSQDDADKALKKARRAIDVALPLIRESLAAEIRVAIDKSSGETDYPYGEGWNQGLRRAENIVRNSA